MPDTQIHPTGTVSAPADYPIPSSAEILLKMAFAKFDGSGAAGSFKPCLRIISDAGTVAGEAATDETVAAGASADVTWFPRVAAAVSAAPPSSPPKMPFATASCPSFVWPHPGDTFADFAGGSVQVSDPAAYTNNIGVDSFTPILIKKAGIYLAWASIGPWDPAWGTQARITSLGPALGDLGGVFGATQFPLAFADYGGPNGFLSLSLVSHLGPDPFTPAEVRLEIGQNSGADRTISLFVSVLRLTTNYAGT